MPITINTNIAAMSAQRNLESASMRSQSSLSKLSSGSRVPTAKEDAASLSIGTGLKLDVTALKAAQTNAAQGTSMLQIADGALGEISEILDRMKSLATTAQSGQLSSTERGFLNQEYGLLHAEINRISDATQFNGEKLLGADITESVDNIGTDLDEGVVVDFTVDPNVVADDDNFGVFYDDSLNKLSLANTTQGTVQTIDLAAVPGDGETIEVNFADLGVSLTLGDGFDAGADIGAPTDLAAGAAISVTVGFQADIGAGTTDRVIDFQVGIGNVAATDQISVTIAAADFDALVGGAYTQLTDATASGVASTEVDTAVDGINTARANVGSTLNRLEFAQSNLAVTIENTEAARSTLMDVDVSAEMTKFTSEQVLIQAGVSMLAQANQQPSLLLRLLQ